jgi:hypothetical protein
MSLNDGVSETFIFQIKCDMFKVVINFTKGMYTVYAPNGRILLRKEKMTSRDLQEVRKKVIKYMNGEIIPITFYHPFRGFRI